MSALVTAVAVSAAAGAYSSNRQASAARRGADAQSAAAFAGIDEQRRQFDEIQALLSPYVRGGTMAFSQQQDLMGLNGADPQRAALEALQQSPQFTESLRQGEEGILQNASATGGLRGGNTQGALAEFRPQVLSQLINQQLSRYGGLAQMGQASAAMQANAGQARANNISGLLQQQGAARAGASLATGQAFGGLLGGMGGLIGQNFGTSFTGGFGGGGGTGSLGLPNPF